MKKNAAALVVATLLAVPVVSFGAMAGANTVNSAAIVDGAVATVDLANLAVTTAKIATNAVNNAKISDVAMTKVTGLAAELATKADQAATTAALAAKANANHSHLIGNMTTVATEGGEYTSPLTAMNDLANWCGTPSTSNPCLIKIMPGTYDLGAAGIVPISNVSFEGSGAAVTKITSTNYSGTISEGTYYSNVTVRDLTIETTGITSSAIRLGGNSALAIYDSAIIAGAASTTYGFGVQLWGGASLLMNNSTFQIAAAERGLGILAGYQAKSVSLSNVTMNVSVPNGTQNDNGANGIVVENYPAGNFALDLDHVTINTSGSSRSALGIALEGSGTAKLTDVKVNCAGAANSTSVMLLGSSQVNMNNVTGNANNGLIVQQAYSYGAGHNVEVMNSAFTGSSWSLLTSGQSSDHIKIANTKLDGPVYNQSVTLKCLGTFDGNFDTVACP